MTEQKWTARSVLCGGSRPNSFHVSFISRKPSSQTVLTSFNCWNYSGIFHSEVALNYKTVLLRTFSLPSRFQATVLYRGKSSFDQNSLSLQLLARHLLHNNDVIPSKLASHLMSRAHLRSTRNRISSFPDNQRLRLCRFIDQCNLSAHFRNSDDVDLSTITFKHSACLLKHSFPVACHPIAI